MPAATIAGNLNINNAQRNFAVNDGAAFYDLVLSANVTGGGTAGRLEKQGAGGLLLSGNNVGLTGSNETQTLPVPQTITSFAINFGGIGSAAIDNLNDTDPQVQAKLQALPSIGLGKRHRFVRGGRRNPHLHADVCQHPGWLRRAGRHGHAVDRQRRLRHPWAVRPGCGP